MKHSELAQISLSTKRDIALQLVDCDRQLDVALLECSDDYQVFPESCVLIPREFWRGEPLSYETALAQFCTDEADTPRSLRIELRPAPSDSTRVEFAVPGGREGLQLGYSGGPVVEDSPRGSVPRMVGIVRARDETSIDALDLAGKGWMVPVERIAERFDAVGRWVESPIERDDSWDQHWEPRSRGVFASSETGFFFSGREAACTAVHDHLTEGQGLLIVTGPRGSGKSAVLSRIVALSCNRYRTRLAASAQGHSPTPLHRLDAAVFARNKEPERVANDIASQLGLPACTPQQLIAAAIHDRRGSAIVVDAIDESIAPDALIENLLMPLATAGTRLVIGSLARYIDAPDAVWVDLGTERYGDDAITPYLTRRLTATGRYRSHDAATIARVAASRAGGNFLVAELTARVLASSEPIDISVVGWQDSLPSDVTGAFRAYLARFGERRARVVALLLPLAYALGDGLPLDPPDLWLAAANALKPDDQEQLGAADLLEASRAARDYLITPSGSARRLYHEGLASAIRTVSARERLPSATRPLPVDAVKHRERADAERFLETLLDRLPASSQASGDAYAASDPYVLRHLPVHLAAFERVEELLDRPGFLLAGDPTAIRNALSSVTSSFPSHLDPERVAVCHALASPHATRAQRAAALCSGLLRQSSEGLAARVKAAFEQAETFDRTTRRVALPYELVCGAALPSALSTISRAYKRVPGSLELAVAEWDVRPLLVCGDSAGALRAWSLDGSPSPLSISSAHIGSVKSIDIIDRGAAPLLLSCGDDGALRSWHLDGSRGEWSHEHAHPGGANWIAAFERPDATHIISSGWSGSLSSWSLDGSQGPLRDDQACTGSRDAVVLVEHRGKDLLVGGGWDGSLQSWWLDGSPGPLLQQGAHYGLICSLVALDWEDAPLLISGGWDGTLRSWRLGGSTGPLTVEEAHTGTIRAIRLAWVDDVPMLVTYGGKRGALRSWFLDGSPGPLAETRPQTGPIQSILITRWEGEPVVITGGSEGVLQSWRLDGSPGSFTQAAHAGAVESILEVSWHGEPLIVTSGGDGALRSWRLDQPAPPRSVKKTQIGPIRAIVGCTWQDAPLLVTGDAYGMLRSLRLDGTPGLLARPHAHSGAIGLMVHTKWERETLLISGGNDGALRSWKLDGSRGPLSEDAHVGPIRTLAIADWLDARLVVSGGRDGALRTWSLGGSIDATDLPTMARLHSGGIEALAVVSWEGAPLLISGGLSGALRSGRLDGSPGPLDVEDAHKEGIDQIIMLEVQGKPILVTFSRRGANLSTWWLDGSPGPLTAKHANNRAISSVTVVDSTTGPLLASGGSDGTLRLWSLDDLSDPLTAEYSQSDPIHSLLVVSRGQSSLLVTGGWDGTLNSLWIDGTKGPLTAEFAHAGAFQLTAVELDGVSVVVSAGSDGTILLHR